MQSSDILITGATGLLGGELVARLLSTRPAARIVCLLRAEDERHLTARRAALLERAGVAPGQRERVETVAGDLEADDLGLGSAAEDLAERVGEIFHAAAATRFDLPLATARRINLEGTRRVVTFARRAQARGGLRGLHHVSTAHTAGDPLANGDGPVFRNTYEQTKWETERELAVVSAELPTTIYRPSIIVGDSQTGRTCHFRALYEPVKWIYRGRAPLLPCRPDTRLDVVPVDFVADAIAALSHRDDVAGRRFTLAAGAAAAIRIDEMVGIAVAAANAYHAEIGAAPIPAPAILAPREGPSGNGADASGADRLFARASQVLRKHLPYMLTEQLFEDAHATALLGAAGLRCPPLDAYLARLVRYALVVDFRTEAKRR